MAGNSDEVRTWSETLQGRLTAKMDQLIAAFIASDDPAEKAQIEKDARACGVFARSAKAVATMVPEPKAKPAADEAADDDEASMHDGIPDDPEELQAALVARFTRFAELLELKRRDDEGASDGDLGPGSPGPAAPA